MKKTTDNKTFKATKLSAIINIVDATLCIMVALAFFILLKTDLVTKRFEGVEAIGFAIGFTIFLILSIICYLPILIHVLFKFYCSGSDQSILLISVQPAIS